MYLKKIMLSLLLFVFITRVTAAENSPILLTLSQRAPIHIHLNLKSEEIGFVQKGEKVEALFQTGLTYQIKSKDGNIGWVGYENFEEAKELVIEPFEDNEVVLYKTLNVNNARAGEKIRVLQKGEKVRYLEGFELKGFVKVRDKNGVIGYTSWHRARPSIEDVIPKYEQLNFVVVLKSQIQDQILNNPIENLETFVGQADARMMDRNENGFLFFRKLYLVENGHRSGHIKFIIKNGLVTSFESQKKPASFWVESLPLATWFRSLRFGIEFQKMQGMDLMPSTSGKGFFIKWGIRLLNLIVIILFFSIPHFLASLLTTILGYLKILPNFFVKRFGQLLSLTFCYVFFLLISLHMIHDQHWLNVILLVIVLFLSFGVINRRILYHRCPSCHSFFKAEDLGSDVIGKTHVTEHKHQDVYKGTRETSTQIIKEYERKHYTEKTTELDVEDHRMCTICEFEWEVNRTKTVKGHV